MPTKGKGKEKQNSSVLDFLLGNSTKFIVVALIISGAAVAANGGLWWAYTHPDSQSPATVEAGSLTIPAATVNAAAGSLVAAGTIDTIDASSVTVKESDGTSQKYTIDTDTKYVKDADSDVDAPIVAADKAEFKAGLLVEVSYVADTKTVARLWLTKQGA